MMEIWVYHIMTYLVSSECGTDPAKAPAKQSLHKITHVRNPPGPDYDQGAIFHLKKIQTNAAKFDLRGFS